MPVSADWYDKDEAIFIYHFEGAWTLQEFHDAINMAEKLLKGYTGRLDVISDLSSTKGYQKGVRPGDMQAAMNRSFRILPEGLGFAIVVGAGVGVKLTIDLLAKIYKPMKHVRTSSTVEEAIAMIKKEREKEAQKSS